MRGWCRSDVVDGLLEMEVTTGRISLDICAVSLLVRGRYRGLVRESVQEQASAGPADVSEIELLACDGA